MSGHHVPPLPRHSTQTRSHTHLPGNGNVSLIHGPLLPGLRTRLAGAAAAREEMRAAQIILMCTWTGLGANSALPQTGSWPHLKMNQLRTRGHAHMEHSCTWHCHGEARQRNILLWELTCVTPTRKSQERARWELVRSLSPGHSLLALFTPFPHYLSPLLSRRIGACLLMTVGLAKLED